jgi:hypothetical protein
MTLISSESGTSRPFGFAIRMLEYKDLQSETNHSNRENSQKALIFSSPLSFTSAGCSAGADTRKTVPITIQEGDYLV